MLSISGTMQAHRQKRCKIRALAEGEGAIGGAICQLLDQSVAICGRLRSSTVIKQCGSHDAAKV